MPNSSIDSNVDYVADFSAETGVIWPTIAAARANGLQVQMSLFGKLQQFTSDDVDVVVFGSLARREWTSGSDVDWTMLIDGQANPEHRVTSRKIAEAIRESGLPAPGAEGIFGNMAFSHEIVHHIGGQADTNRNTTQLVLLLLEATALRDPTDELAGPYARMVRQILNRYLVSDSNFHSRTDDESRIPRFLLNDIVRYWRTMCVDFAYKDWEQAGKKWAIRNIKLRTSRKLLFFAGLLMVFSCFKNDLLRRDGESPNDYLLNLQKHLLNFVQSTPLDIVVWSLRALEMDAQCRDLFGAYEEFLSRISKEALREHLSNLNEEAVYGDDIFLVCREISHRLQATLKKVCFEMDSPLREFTYEYGVF